MHKTQLPASTAYQRLPIRVLNSVLRGLNRIGIAKIDLSAEAMMVEAQKQTGLSDFGDGNFRKPLSLLVQSLEKDADLNPCGRFIQRMSNIRILKHRLWVQELLKKHPEILDRKITRPIVIVGLARSGTTRLHRLLASDPQFAHLKAWESVNPAPFPESYEAKSKGTADPRIANIEQALKAILYVSPQIAAVHPLGALEVEEEIGLLQHAFSSQLFEIQAKIPDFAEWLMSNDQTYAYEYMVVLMKIIGWFRDEPEDKQWVLKTPQHMQDLDALLNVFPDAQLICSHRDPIKAVGSACSMTWNTIVRDCDTIDPFWVGQEWANKTKRMLEKTMKVRDELAAKENQYDVLYADINKDWQKEIQGIYDFLGLELNDEAIRCMEAWRAENAQYKHGKHKYSLADFGLDENEVDKDLMFYRDAYKIPYENRK